VEGWARVMALLASVEASARHRIVRVFMGLSFLSRR
jgi:hypothetical protein